MNNNDDVSIIDWQDCLKITNNNPVIAKEILLEFGLELPKTLKNINQCYEEKNLSPLADLVHQLHGACSYCGVARLKLILQQLENNLRSNTEADNLQNLIAQLNIEAKKVLETLNEDFFNNVLTP
jgi:two-component system sensor histidine kinase BarA